MLSVTNARRFFCMIISSTLFLHSACGVEAGNPDSTDTKLLRIFVAPTSYSDMSVISATVESFVFSGDKSLLSRPSSSSLFTLETKAASESTNTNPAFVFNDFDFKDEVLKGFELQLPKSNPFLLIRLSSQAEPIRAVVINEKGELAESIKFEGATYLALNKSIDVLIDLELRKSLKPLSVEQRAALKLPNDVTFSLVQRHNFQNVNEVGAISFSGFEPGSLLCVFNDGSVPDFTKDDCTSSKYKSQIVSKDGSASIGGLKPGTYDLVNIKTNKETVTLQKVLVAANAVVKITGN